MTNYHSGFPSADEPTEDHHEEPEGRTYGRGVPEHSSPPGPVLNIVDISGELKPVEGVVLSDGGKRDSSFLKRRDVNEAEKRQMVDGPHLARVDEEDHSPDACSVLDGKRCPVCQAKLGYICPPGCPLHDKPGELKLVGGVAPSDDWKLGYVAGTADALKPKDGEHWMLVTEDEAQTVWGLRNGTCAVVPKASI